jgi:hypothetical protein
MRLPTRKLPRLPKMLLLRKLSMRENLNFKLRRQLKRKDLLRLLQRLQLFKRLRKRLRLLLKKPRLRD